MCKPKSPREPTPTPSPAAAQPCPKCCCCVKSVSISNVQLFTVPPSVRGGAWVANGHQFDLTIQMDFCGGATGTSDCTLEWWESTNDPYYGNLPTTKGTDMYATLPTSGTFNPWNNRTPPCPGGGTLSVVIVDIPSLGNPPGVTKKRTLKFRIVVRSGTGCTCNLTSVTVTATQVLQMVNGTLVTGASSFKIGPSSQTP